MRSSIIAIASVLFALSACARAGGRLVVVGSDTVALGRYRADEQKVAGFSLENAGDAPVEILRVRTDCGCSAAEIGSRRLAPGETSMVEVTVKAGSLSGPFRKNAFVESSDPGNPLIRLTVTGEAVLLVAVKPSMYVDAGDLSGETAWQGSVKLVSGEADLLLGEPLTAGLVAIGTQLERMTPESGSLYRLEMTVSPPEQIGNFHGLVSIPVLRPAGTPVKIFISGRVGTELVMIPAIAYLQTTDQPQTRRFLLRLADARANPLIAEDLEISDHPGVSASVSPHADGKALELTLTFEPVFLDTFDEKREIPLQFRVPDAPAVTLRCRLR